MNQDENYTKLSHILKDTKLFNEDYYRKHNQDLPIGEDAAKYYIENNRTQLRCPSQYFHPGWYKNHYEDVKKSNIEPLMHYLLFGQYEDRLYRYAPVDFKKLDIPNKAEVKKYYDTIFNSPLFDINYYLKHNGNIDLEGYDPIVHYILKGAQMGYNPSKNFNTQKYLLEHKTDKLMTNPLYHYIKYGDKITDKKVINEFDKQTGLISKKRYPRGTVKDILEHLEKKVSIIIPVYNAYEETCDCIRSVLLNTDANYELIIINDASPDERIKPLLDSLEGIENVRIIHNEENQGFVKNVNKGMVLAADNDVVLLNSDTIVTPRWLSKMVTAAYSDSTIATATPLSSASDISVPSLGESKDQLFLNKNAYQVSKIDYDSYLESPTGNGFCLYVKRGAIRKLGMFDTIFEKGYGEETDFTSRAHKAGWKNIRVLDVFIYHRRHASFTSEKSNYYKARNKKIIQQRYPEVYDMWDNFVKTPHLQDTLEKIKKNVMPYSNGEKILFVTEMKDSQPVITDEFYKIAEKYDTHILALDKEGMALFIYDGISKFTPIYSNKLMQKSKLDAQRSYFNILVNQRYDLMFIRQFKYYLSYEFSNLNEFIKYAKPLEIKTINEGMYHEDLLSLIEKKLNPIKSLDEIVEDKKNEFSFKDKKVAVYTAVTGGYDDVIIPSVVEEDFDYICFTDNEDFKSDFWEVRYITDSDDLDNIRKARKCKILPHKYLPEYDCSFWIDGNFNTIGSLKDYVKKYYKNNKLLAIEHEERRCIYREAQACIDQNKDSIEKIENQINRYKEEGYPYHNGLVASGILFREHKDSELIDVMNTWYDEVKNYSYRDQLSFNYACWKHNFKFDLSDLYYFKNEYFERLGHTKNKKFDGKLRHLRYDNETKDQILTKLQEPTTIIIPIYNAYDDTQKCIKSVIRNTKLPYELLLINDNSPDERIEPMLRDFEERYENIHIISNPVNKGFVKNVNIGLQYDDNDVLLLNSDTIVTEKWLMKLKCCAYESSDIATVTPVSNKAGAFSVPVMNYSNCIAPEVGLKSTANIIEKLSSDSIDTPTANGFCMFIKREVIDKVGLFDLNFGRGYCEENDFSMRALNAGYRNVIDTTTYIFHNHSSSFGEEKLKLMEKNRQYLDAKHPTYKAKITQLVNDEKYAQIRADISDALKPENIEDYDTKNLLYVMHEGKGGTLYTSVDLMQHVSDEYNIYLLTASRRDMKLFKYQKVSVDDGGIENDREFEKHLKQIEQWDFKSKYTIAEASNPEFELIYFNVLKQLNIDLVHTRHLVRHTFDLPRVANLMGIKVLLSFHDFYFVCPSHNLIDDKGKYCNGICTPMTTEDPDEGQCSVMLGLGVPVAKRFNETWHELVSEMFENCSEFITTSKSAYDIYTRIYPQLKEKPFHIIEHGRDLKIPDNIEITTDIENDDPIRIVVPGNISISKGADYVYDLKKCDKDNKIELHFMGDVYGEYDFEKVGVVHGRYKRSEFNDIVHSINPHFIGIFSIWPETYCHTLTEAWSSGVPVLCQDLGAPGERIRANGGGYLISSDPKEAYEQIISFKDKPAEYEEIMKSIEDITIKSTRQMADEYLRIYNSNMKNVLYLQNSNDLKLSSEVGKLSSNSYVLTSDENSIKLYMYDEIEPDYGEFGRNF